MYFGVDYYPEHWVYPYGGSADAPESRWERDIELMLDAGVNVVRMGEFAWALYEPEEGKFGCDWAAWLEAKYGTIERLNEFMGGRFWAQTVTAWDQVPMPMVAPTVHNPALIVDWQRFCSDTIVAYARMQVSLLHEITPDIPVTH